ncbi:hypothetical protein FEF65_03790 [Mariprofundus erugo]|uniref:Uncharacterized protein n=1 Tax=Mariprofundus erugo TaxID=2528639 RepID=A0A5R9GRA4_9PROT|nr:SIR2 family protein [Mariprofundus erugo]TLS68128.1 hypothetical protein FEF65_03790 [Mariprofundus erugo]
MGSPDNLDTILEAPFHEALEALDALMAQNGKVFLLGAGCSKCAGLPLMEELTAKVLGRDGLDVDTSDILKGIQKSFAGASGPNIEDYLSEIVDLLAIAERRAERGATDKQVSINGKKYSGQQLRESAEKIKRTISDIIECDGDKIDVAVHREFVKAVHRPMRPGKLDALACVDYLSLNYDTLLEDALALERVSFSDGLEGGVTGWWNPVVFDRDGLSSRVFKLHGSINWCEFKNDPLPRRVAGNVNVLDEGDKRILIWPASTKYRETQRDPYAQLAEYGRKALRAVPGSQKILITCGYRFGDSHINLEIDRALRESAGRLTVVAFTSDNDPQGQLKKWHGDPSITEQVLIFANRGFFHGSNKTLSNDDLLWWKFENLTRLLGGER